MEHVVDFATSVMMHLAARTRDAAVRARRLRPRDGRRRRGYGAYLGTVPDYSAMDATTGGVLLADVRPGSPADKAGIRGGTASSPSAARASRTSTT